ncbi:hypothetical protein ACFRMQ_02190 [Kitasatospora sp. NPDC056783]|uniref:hypothetical protein n=1 Tax=Kitasatospora sp. NPDC056783 TaxID=3345943 RepID=UPI0036B9D09B
MNLLRKAASAVLPLVLAGGAGLVAAGPANAAVSGAGCRNIDPVGAGYRMGPCSSISGSAQITFGTWMQSGNTDVNLYGRVDLVVGNTATPWDCNRGPVHIYPSSMQYYDLGACNLKPGTYVVETWITNNGQVVGDMQSPRIYVS